MEDRAKEPDLSQVNREDLQELGLDPTDPRADVDLDSDSHNDALIRLLEKRRRNEKHRCLRITIPHVWR